jgi:ribosomal protein S18 acetylase RimI-like enzyme
MSEYKTKFAKLVDKEKIFRLYQAVARNLGGIAREADEISLEYISHNLQNALKTGVCLVIDNPHNAEEIVAEIHCYKLTPKVFSHVLSELTIVVHPDFQKLGLGKLIFTSLLQHIEENRKDILRVELIARESNQKAIAFYEKIGFKIEGRFEKRIDNKTKDFEADIPMAWFNKNFESR